MGGGGGVGLERVGAGCRDTQSSAGPKLYCSKFSVVQGRGRAGTMRSSRGAPGEHSEHWEPGGGGRAVGGRQGSPPRAQHSEARAVLQ